ATTRICAFFVEGSLEDCSSEWLAIKCASTVHLFRCRVRLRRVTAEQVAEARDIPIVIFESAAEKMAAAVVGDEVQVIRLCRVKRSAERGLTRIGDRPWRKA